MQALRDAGPATFDRIVTVGHDRTKHTRPGLVDGVLRLVTSHTFRRLAKTTVDAMVKGIEDPGRNAPVQFVLSFDLHTAENL